MMNLFSLIIAPVLASRERGGGDESAHFTGPLGFPQPANRFRAPEKRLHHIDRMEMAYRMQMAYWMKMRLSHGPPPFRMRRSVPLRSMLSALSTRMRQPKTVACGPHPPTNATDEGQ